MLDVSNEHTHNIETRGNLGENSTSTTTFQLITVHRPCNLPAPGTGAGPWQSAPALLPPGLRRNIGQKLSSSGPRPEILSLSSPSSSPTWAARTVARLKVVPSSQLQNSGSCSQRWLIRGWLQTWLDADSEISMCLTAPGRGHS